MNKHARNTADFHIQYTTNGKRIAQLHVHFFLVEIVSVYTNIQ